MRSFDWGLDHASIVAVYSCSGWNTAMAISFRARVIKFAKVKNKSLKGIGLPTF